MRRSDADLHHQKGSLQHPRARGDELSDLHVRLDQRRPAGPTPGEPEHHAAAVPLDRAQQEPRPADRRALRVLGEGCRHESVRDDTVRPAKDLAGSEAGDGTHAAVRPDGDHSLRPHRRLDRRLFGLTPVLRVRLHNDDNQFRRLRNACVLARADVAGGGRQHLLEVARARLLYVRPFVAVPGSWHPLVRRPRPAPCPSGDRALHPRRRRLQPLHARLDARGPELRFRPHGTRERPHRATRDHEACVSGTR